MHTQNCTINAKKDKYTQNAYKYTQKEVHNNAKVSTNARKNKNEKNSRQQESVLGLKNDK